MPRIPSSDEDPQTQAQYWGLPAFEERDPRSSLESQRTVSWLSVEHSEFLCELHTLIVFQPERTVSLYHV